MRILLLQLDPLIGDIPGNAGKIREGVVTAGRDSADLIVTPELILTGYPPRDLLLFRGFIDKVSETAAALAADLEGYPPILVGAVKPSTSSAGRLTRTGRTSGIMQ